MRSETLCVVAMSVSTLGRSPFDERRLEQPIHQCLAAAKSYSHLI
jgi:hypothetical protein